MKLKVRDFQSYKTLNKANVSSIRDLKDQIANHVLELNDLKEKNTRDLKAVNELKQLMKDLQEGVDC